MEIHLNWQENYKIGIEEIDLQHHYFANLIKRLAIELDKDKDPYYQKRLIRELSQYAVFHFLSEENLMMKYGYPDLANHQEFHRTLIEELTNSIQADSPKELVQFLVNWFIQHTTGEDKAFGRFVDSKGLARSKSTSLLIESSEARGVMMEIHLKWQSDYETGIEEVDLQHHYFMDLIKRLSIEFDENKDPYYHKRLIRELTQYALFHFVSEENLMMKYGYAELANHQELHRTLIENLTSFSQSESPDELMQFLISWFLNHTAGEDKVFGRFVASKDSD